ncbi:hypothetical protein Q7O_003168 [Pectobacterium carotovorum subsp. carotovorum PCCS1]|nr:hypothetical protein [Pectobacterium carotovorum subsp. carotovorum PCCS1]
MWWLKDSWLSVFGIITAILSMTYSENDYIQRFFWRRLLAGWMPLPGR